MPNSLEIHNFQQFHFFWGEWVEIRLAFICLCWRRKKWFFRTTNTIQPSQPVKQAAQTFVCKWKCHWPEKKCFNMKFPMFSQWSWLVFPTTGSSSVPLPLFRDFETSNCNWNLLKNRTGFWLHKLSHSHTQMTTAFKNIQVTFILLLEQIYMYSIRNRNWYINHGIQLL